MSEDEDDYYEDVNYDDFEYPPVEVAVGGVTRDSETEFGETGKKSPQIYDKEWGRGDQSTSTTGPESSGRYTDPEVIAEREFGANFRETCKKEGEFERAIQIIRKLDNLITLNMQLLSLAACFHATYGKTKSPDMGVNRDNIAKFVRERVHEKTEEAKNNAILDIIRYIRLYTSVVKLS